MLHFTSNGLLTPSSIIPSTLNEFKAYFAIDSPDNVRIVLYDKYINYSNKLKEVCENVELKRWIDGSFVTKKPTPSWRKDVGQGKRAKAPCAPHASKHCLNPFNSPGVYRLLPKIQVRMYCD